MGVIYKLTSPSGKSYIGQTVFTFPHRWDQHQRAARDHLNCSRLLERAIRKYGAENFKTEVLVECDNDMLNEFEKRFIGTYLSNDRKFGYNLTSGGDGCLINDCTKDLISKGLRKYHGNNLPKYIIKAGCKNSGYTGYSIWKHPKCKRKRFCGPPEDDAKQLQRAIEYIAKLEKGEIKKKEKLPQYMCYEQRRDGYQVRYPLPSGGYIRKSFGSSKLTREQKKQQALDQLEAWKVEYNTD